MKKLENARICRTERLFTGNWLTITGIDWDYNDGKEHRWEVVNRLREGGAVVIIATLKPSGRLLLVKQFRPPVGHAMIEFPAGLIDPDEKIADAARRELREETGYIGTVDLVWPKTWSSPGLAGEYFHFVEMSINESFPENQNPTTAFDDSEAIETLIVSREELFDFLCALKDVGIDAKLLTYARNLPRRTPAI